MAIFRSADSRVDVIRKDVANRKRVGARSLENQIARSTSGVMGSGSAAMASGAGISSNEMQTERQYASFKNTVATAVRPIMVRFASQPIRVGYTATRKQLATEKWMQGIAQKAYSVSAERSIRESAPNYIKASVGTSITAVESHPFLDLLASPNELYTQIALMQCTAASLVLTGRVAWWFDSSGDVRPENGMSTRIWYVPWHWLEFAGPPENPFAKFKMRTPYAGEIEIPGEDLFYAMIPHPQDPTRAWSAVQGQAASVDTDENILAAQYTSMKNVIRPNLIITAGTVPGLPKTPNSRGQRAALDAIARGKLTDAIKSHYQGVMKYGEPLILDALIEDVRPLIAGPLELDLLNSTSVTQSRVMQGIGTSPVVAGYAENANRAGSVTAHEVFYDLVLNPLISLFSQSLEVMARRRYGVWGASKTSLKVWMDEAKPRDVDQIHERVAACQQVMRVGELREYLRSGSLILEEQTPEDAMWFKDFASIGQSLVS